MAGDGVAGAACRGGVLGFRLGCKGTAHQRQACSGAAQGGIPTGIGDEADGNGFHGRAWTSDERARQGRTLSCYRFWAAQLEPLALKWPSGH